MKVRLKIEYTEEYQSEYTSPKFSERRKKALIKRVKREVWTDTGKKEGVWPILSYRGKEFVWFMSGWLEKA